MVWHGIGNPQPGHLRNPNGPGLAIAKALFGGRKNKQGKAVKR